MGGVGARDYSPKAGLPKKGRDGLTYPVPDSELQHETQYTLIHRSSWDFFS